MTWENYQISSFDYSSDLYIGFLFKPYSETSTTYYTTPNESENHYLTSDKKYKAIPGENIVNVKVIAEDTSVQFNYTISFNMLYD
jgi:hypothetical protein